MRKVDSKRLSLQLTRQSYSLTPKRGAGIWLGLIAAVCAIAALAAAGFALKRSNEDAHKLDALCAPPASEQTLRDQLVHAQLALEQEAASRTEQRVKDRTAEIQRLQTDLAFLRKQHKPD
jgi:capsule polysaccharide export protein KpsE/RkpR